MKIAQVTQHYLPVIGGQEVYIENLLRVFREAGIESEIYQPDRGVRRGDVITVPRVKGLGRLVHGSEPYVFDFFLWLLKLRRLSRADLIIAHYAFSAWPLRRFAKKTIILSHGIEWHLENMTWDDRIHDRIARERLDAFPHVVNDTHYLRHFGYGTPPATGYFEEVAPRKWFIPNCVDTARFSRTSGLAEIKARNIILVPRQVTRDRGIDLAIRAFGAISSQHPALTLHVLGKIRHCEYYRGCLDLARALGIEKRVIFQDGIANDKMADFYSSALCTVIPTLRREGTSLSALESMACGTATISTDVAGLRDLPTVQSAPTPEALAAAMTDTLARREQIGAQQSAIVRNQFNLSNWSAAWLRVVRAVVGGNS